MRARWLIVEAVVLVAAIVVAWWAGARATDAWLARATELGLDVDAAAVRGLARRADAMFTVGVVALAAARVVALGRARDPIAVPWLVPAVVLAALLGLITHHATFEVAGGAARPPSAAGFAQGFLIGSVVAAAIVAAPVDLVELASRWRAAVAAAIALVFVALAVAGSGPAGSGTRINLGPVQPIELVKLLTIVFLAGFLGARAAKLRWQRRRFAGLRWPRVELMLPALAALLLIVAGLFVLGDLGPVLLLGLVYLGMFFVATRATGWAAVALLALAAVFTVLATWPSLADVGTVETRLRMWQDPWGNGMRNGHQLGEGLWAVAAGGWTGQGLADNATPIVAAGKTDLILVTMTEQLGALGLLGYQLMIGAIALAALVVATRARTAERTLLAVGAAILVVAQWALIQAGCLGQLPLTGIVAPFLSSGRTSMIAFLAVVAVVARVAHDGHPRALTDELVEVRHAAWGVGVVAAAALVVGVLAGVHAAVLARDDVSVRTIAVTLADGTRIARENPRLVELAAQIRRGTIEDRHGDPLAHDAALGERRYPLADALGTLLGVHPTRVRLPGWSLERAFDDRLRIAPRRLAPLLALDDADRRRALAAIDADLASRSVRISIDAELQREAATLLRAAVDRPGRVAAAAAVIDVDTGQVLARVQVPDYDPGEPTWQAHVVDLDAAYLRRFQGAYGAWPDKTGVQGMFQAGSVAKLFTALAAARSGAADAEFACVEEDAQGPFHVEPGWPKPIHDHPNDRPHGRVDLIEAIAVSCNVYFAQLGVALGPDAFTALRAAGADIGYDGARGFAPGAPGSRALASTAFGQGAMAMNVVQAARLVAAIAGDGRYRRCAPTMELAAPCTEVVLVDDPATLAPILEGMRRVMTAGTGKRLAAPDGVRVFGKTGTADAQGFVGEAPFGIAPGQRAAPHSWFVAIAEPADAPGRRRIAVAVVVPRGGTGASAAGPLAMQLIGAARRHGYLTAP